MFRRVGLVPGIAERGLKCLGTQESVPEQLSSQICALNQQTIALTYQAFLEPESLSCNSCNS